MHDVESKLWRVRSVNDAYVQITQKASGVTRMFSRSTLPSWNTMAMINEKQFDKLLRDAFHGNK